MKDEHIEVIIDNFIYLIIGFLFVGLCLGMIIGVPIGRTKGKEQTEQKMIKLGVAKYICDESTGWKNEIRFIEKSIEKGGENIEK